MKLDEMKTNLWVKFKNEPLCIGHKILSSLPLAISFDFQASVQLIWALR